MTKNKIYFFFIFCLSCTFYPPTIKIDLTNQSVETKYGQPLKSLSLETKEPLDIILILPNYDMPRSNIIYLDSISSNFEVLHNTHLIKEKRITFRPNSIYELKHSGGDQASYYLTLEIDSFGKISKVIK